MHTGLEEEGRGWGSKAVEGGGAKAKGVEPRQKTLRKGGGEGRWKSGEALDVACRRPDTSVTPVHVYPRANFAVCKREKKGEMKRRV